MCYDFEVCPETCEAYVIIDDRVCVGYEVYVNGTYQLTEGQGETLDGYCTFTVPEGDHTIEIRKDGCSEIVFNYQYFQCNEHYYKIPDTDWCYCDKPDLIIHDFLWSPTNPKEGDEIKFTTIVKNIGKADAKDAFEVFSAVEAGSDYYPCDLSFTVPHLAADEEYTNETTWKASECGGFSVIVTVDFWDAIKERDEDNNYVSLPLNISCAEKEWSFMVYMDADNGIEWMAVNVPSEYNSVKGDFLEMAEIGSTDEVNVVVQLDRRHGGDDDRCYDFGDWSTCKRFYITKNLEPYPNNGVDIDEINMGNPNELYEFIAWVKENYPAQNYCLVLWDHGSGWEGCCRDDSSNDDKLTLQEIKQAFERADINFDVLVFDACIMGNIETVYQLKDYANTFVVSEEVTGHHMSPYDAILQELTKKSSMGSDELGRIWVDKYYEFYKPIEILSYDTRSKVDSSNIISLKDSVDTLAKKLIQYWPSYRKEISTAREYAEEYANSEIIHIESRLEHEYVDIYDFSRLIKESDVPNDC